jgi:HAD superfamily hydrolase (TIGR01490 family)
MRLALFDLDHTLLSGDSDVLWCDYLIRCGLLDESWRERCDRIAERYIAGTTTPQDYCDFHASLLAGRTVAELLPLRRGFFDGEIAPRIPDDARALLKKHRDAGDRLVLTTATNRAVSEFTAHALAVDDYVATEVEVMDGRYTGRTLGEPNLRVGKVQRLRARLIEQGLPDTLLRQATFYSDSINDLPLFSVVRHPVVVDPDPRLASTAMRKGWTVLHLRR